MSQTAIPLEFEKYLQNKISLNQPTALNEVIFAMIPDLDLSKPIDRSVTLPPLEYWVHQQYVDQIGKSGSNAVVYSVVIPGSKEPFTFNAMFLRDDNVPNSCGMVVYKATETKEKGMALTKSMLMQFDGAASAANITVDAATWQIDYQARLNGIDEEHRLSCLDNYGHAAFVGGFGVARHETDQSKYIVEPGVAYIGGLRIQSTLSTVQTITNKPTTLWLDVFRDGTALSTHENLFQVVVSNDDLADYTDEDGRIHYVAKLASIEAGGATVDLRVEGGLDLAEMKSNAATDEDIDSESQDKKHVKLPQLWRAINKYTKLKYFVGLIGEFHDAGAKAGWVDLKGGELSRITDKLLWDYAVSAGMTVAQAIKDADPITHAMKFGDGDGATTFTLPNHHLGHFVRGNPSGVNHGETQGDAIRNITGNWNGTTEGITSDHASIFDGALFTNGRSQSLNYGGQSQNQRLQHVGFDASRSVPTDNENRPYTANLSIKIHRGWM